MIDLNLIRRAYRHVGRHKVAFEMERRAGGVAPEDGGPLRAAATAIGARYAKHATESRRIVDGLAALKG